MGNFKIKKIGNNYKLSVDVTNTGKVAGSEVVQFYVTKPDGKNEHPALELVGFGKTAVLNAGESETVTCRVTYNELRTYVTSDEEWIVEQGEYKFHVGASSKSIHDTKSVSRCGSTMHGTSREAVLWDSVPASTQEKNIETILKKNIKLSRT